MWLEALSGDEHARMNVVVNGGEQLLMAMEREPAKTLLGRVAAALEKTPFALSVHAGGATIGVTHVDPRATRLGTGRASGAVNRLSGRGENTR